jgi:DNA-binding transcriptional LysR family regulator
MSMNVGIRKMQFVELFEFVVVAEYRSFARAAAHLGVSIATLRQTIRAVEERLGLRLFDLTTRHVSPTPVGECLLQRLRPVLKDLMSALEEPNEYRRGPVGYHLGIPADRSVDIDSCYFDAGIRSGGYVAMHINRESRPIVVGAPA